MAFFNRLPRHLIDHEKLLTKLEALTGSDPDLNKQANINEIFFELYKLANNAEQAFVRVVHWGDPYKVFPFLQSSHYDFSLDHWLAKLIQIDAGKTVDYMLKKETKNSQGFNIIDKCMNVLHKSS